MFYVARINQKSFQLSWDWNASRFHFAVSLTSLRLWTKALNSSLSNFMLGNLTGHQCTINNRLFRSRASLNICSSVTSCDSNNHLVSTWFHTLCSSLRNELEQQVGKQLKTQIKHMDDESSVFICFTQRRHAWRALVKAQLPPLSSK